MRYILYVCVWKNYLEMGVALVTWHFWRIWNPFISSERSNIETPYLVQHVLAIAGPIGVVRSRDLILQYHVKVGNKTANINVRLKHDVRAINHKSNIENITDHFYEDTGQNKLAALTNLGHVTPFLLLGPLFLTIQLGERNHFTAYSLTGIGLPATRR